MRSSPRFRTPPRAQTDRCSSRVEQRRDELAGPRRPCQFERDWSAVGLDGDAETEETTASPFCLNRLCNECEHIVVRGELQTVAVWKLLMALRTLQQIREQPLASGLERDGRQRAHDGQIRHRKAYCTSLVLSSILPKQRKIELHA